MKRQVSETEAETVVPVIAEEVHAEARKVKTGAVRVHKAVHEHEEVIDQPLMREDADIFRVIKNQVVEGPLQVHYSDDEIVIPLVKEVLRVQKEFVLTEEIHIRRRRSMERHAEKVAVQHEEAVIERTDAEGNVVARSAPESAARQQAAQREVRPARRNKVLR